MSIGDGVKVFARRCFGDIPKSGVEEVVELSIAQNQRGSWFNTCVILTPEQSLDLAAALFIEARYPLERGLPDA